MLARAARAVKSAVREPQGEEQELRSSREVGQGKRNLGVVTVLANRRCRDTPAAADTDVRGGREREEAAADLTRVVDGQGAGGRSLRRGQVHAEADKSTLGIIAQVSRDVVATAKWRLFAAKEVDRDLGGRFSNARVEEAVFARDHAAGRDQDNECDKERRQHPRQGQGPSHPAITAQRKTAQRETLPPPLRARCEFDVSSIRVFHGLPCLQLENARPGRRAVRTASGVRTGSPEPLLQIRNIWRIPRYVQTCPRSVHGPKENASITADRAVRVECILD